MNAHTIAFVLSRLFAVYLTVNHAVSLAFVMLGLPFVPDITPAAYMLNGIGAAVYLVIAAGLWFGARWLAGRVAKPGSPDLPHDMAFENWQALAVAALGWLGLLPVIRLAGESIEALISGSVGGPPLSFTAFMSVAYLVISLVLITQAGRIVSGLNALRIWAGKPLIQMKDE